MRKRSALVLVVVLVLFAYFVLSNGATINTFFGTPSAQGYLLLGVIATGILVPLFTRWLDKRDSRRRQEALIYKEILQQWNASSHLGSCSFSSGGINHREPSDPIAFSSLYPDGQTNFKSTFKDMWEAWEALKSKSNELSLALKDLYERSEDRTEEIVEKPWVAEMETKGVTYKDYFADTKAKKYYYPSNLRCGVLQEMINRMLHSSKTDITFTSNILQLANPLAIGDRPELESLKSRIETAFNDQELKDLVLSIGRKASEYTATAGDLLQKFESRKAEAISRINWQHLMREKVQSQVVSY